MPPFILLKINITCRTSGGNPSDTKNYIYSWGYKPIYGASAAYIPVPSGTFLNILYFYILMVNQIHCNCSYLEYFENINLNKIVSME